MPIYEFVCTACDHPFERLVMSTTEMTLPPCPKCGKENNVEKKISAVFTRPHGIPSGTGGFKAPTCASKVPGGG